MPEICIHGHFYQPSRANPWTGEWESQPSAAPFRDWNRRITAECYAPNAAARLLDASGATRAICNNYSFISFDMGPTLLEWIVKNEPALLSALRAADRQSISRFGRGSALAQPYHHPILPLCSPADRRTEIAWGLAVFRRVFRRDAEGMWMPETAMDMATLEALADAGLSFTIVTPRQIAGTRALGATAWEPPEDPNSMVGRAYRVALSGGRSIVLVPYEMGVSHAIAFQGLLDSGDELARRLLRKSRQHGFQLVATDGESYGHHHRFGEMALAYAIELLSGRTDVALTNVASWLSRNPPTSEALVEGASSWSCPHGVERWRSDCGCGREQGSSSHQRWRGPLRAALDGLRDAAGPVLDTVGKALFRDPALARDAYGQVMGRPDLFGAWYEAHRSASGGDRERARRYLEIQRHLLAMYTSCAWFFQEVTRIEALQNLRHAACAVGNIRILTGLDLSRLLTESVAKIPANGDPGVLRETVARFVHPPPPRSEPQPMSRLAGVLLPVSALQGSGPIGDLDAAIPWLDWLASAGMALWQVLPLVPADFTGSPYSSWSALSGDPLLCGLEPLVRAGLLEPSHRLPATERVDHRAARTLKMDRILLAAEKLVGNTRHPWFPEFRAFAEREDWAREAALFHALKIGFGGAPWWEWPDSARRRESGALEAAREAHARQVDRWLAALFFFERQWAGVRHYAAARGLRILGDVPIYVARDSVDVWCSQHLFQLDSHGRARAVAGVPPDALSETGQLWGNPLFDWDAMAADDYRWWVARMRRCLELCDYLRIDHFIGFSRYWSVPAEAGDATAGTWKPGPGAAVFRALRKALGGLPFIAEDLGSVDRGTVELRDELGLPGMKVLIFSFDQDPLNPHKPANHPHRAVVCPTTHDTETVRGWWEGLDPEHQRWLHLGRDGAEVAETLCNRVLSSPAAWAILPLQDILGLGNEARMNVPGTTEGNWCWRCPAGVLTPRLASALKQRIRETRRLRPRAF